MRNQKRRNVEKSMYERSRLSPLWYHHHLCIVSYTIVITVILNASEAARRNAERRSWRRGNAGMRCRRRDIAALVPKIREIGDN